MAAKQLLGRGSSDSQRRNMGTDRGSGREIFSLRHIHILSNLPSIPLDS